MADEPCKTRPRVVICDDHRVVAESFRRMLEPDYAVVGIVTDAADLVPLLRSAAVELLLLDLWMPGFSGLELLRSAREAQPRMKILVVTVCCDRVLAEACLHDGADGFFPKVASREELLDAMARVLAGERYLSPRVPKTSHDAGLEAAHAALWRLTAPQERVFRLLGEGLRPYEIAARIGRSQNTVEFHVKGIMRNLGINSAAALVRMAVLLGACEEPERTKESDKTARESGGGGDETGSEGPLSLDRGHGGRSHAVQSCGALRLGLVMA